ncbi:protein fem-1 homolog C-like [Mizuhopecten yessoensis]|uniref:Protein fem-1-like C n=1 Tax=Mizuhopecten yessoensis TaxID=6573 RepID=A0A210PIQ4_MIZYE|nr:protein fem-1 homolog C-like [Mizuhopecten yessoensis]OWF36378.1 Protein fem-1-like C [Mizuhopecten yessoensis]
MSSGNDSDVRYITLGEFLQETRFDARPSSLPGNNQTSDIFPEQLDTDEDLLDVPKQADIIRNMILKEEHRDLEERLMRIRHKERKETVDYRIDGSSAFFICCASNNVDLCSFLLDRCGADVDQKGTDSPFGWQPNLPLCSPLCCAARHVDSLPLVRLLIEHGANKKGVDETGTTAIQIACQTGCMETVLYLFEHGYSVHDVSPTGKTCLILAVQNTEICKFLISKGVEVDHVDSNSSSALHYAVRDGQLDTVKLFIVSGADVNMTDKQGLDVILRAASAVQVGVVEHLMHDPSIPARSKVLAYKLLGSSLADTGKELEAVYWWDKTRPRECDFASDDYVQQLIADGRKLSVGIARSSQPTEELELLERIQAYSVRVKIEIFGLCHPQTYKSLCRLLNINFLMMSLKHSLKLLRYAAEVFVQKDQLCNKAAPYIASRLMKVFNRIWQCKKEVKPEDRSSIIAEVIDILGNLIDHVSEQYIQSRSDSVEFEQMEDDNISSFVGLSSVYSHKHAEVFEWMCLALDLVCIVRSLEPNIREEAKLISHLSKLVEADPRGPSEETLLHIAVTLNPNYRPYLSTDMVFRCNRYEVARSLIHAGIDVNAIDVNRNIPLCSLLQVNANWIEDEKTLINLLLEYGSDIDIRNKDGLTTLALLQRAGITICQLNYQKLQCLAAATIRSHNIKFAGYVPKKIETFITSH